MLDPKFKKYEGIYIFKDYKDFRKNVDPDNTENTWLQKQRSSRKTFRKLDMS